MKLIGSIINFRPIWAQFMNFEATVGDLSSIKKVETRMMSNLNSQVVFTYVFIKVSKIILSCFLQAKPSLKIDPKNLIERYKVFDLVPGKVEELEATQNGTDITKPSKSKELFKSSKDIAPKAAPKLANMTKPDTSQMIPFKVKKFFVFSAFGGIRTGSKIPVLTAYLPVLAYGILGKGGLFVTPPLEDCLTGTTGSSTQAETGCTDLQLIGSSVADSQALT